MNPQATTMNTSPKESNTMQMFLTDHPSPALQPSEIDIQQTLDTLEKETEKTYIYNNSSVFRYIVHQKVERSSSVSSTEVEGEHSDSSNCSASFLDDSTEDALHILREWVRRNDPVLHHRLLASEELGTIPLLLDLCNQLCDKATKKSARERSPIFGQLDVVLEDGDFTNDSEALDLVMKILIDATHEGNVQQTAHAVALQFLASPDPDENARGTQAFLPDNYGPKVLAKVLRQQLYHPQLQKHGWATFGNVMNNAPTLPSIETLGCLDNDEELIKSLLEAALVSLQVHKKNHEVVHVVLNTVGTMIHKLSLFRKQFLDHKRFAFEILTDVYRHYTDALDNHSEEPSAIHHFLSVASRWMRLVFYLTRTSKKIVVGESVKPALSQDDWKMMVETVIDIVNRLPLERKDDNSIEDVATEEAHTFLCWLQVQVILKMTCGFFETCMHHGVDKEYLVNAGALGVLSKIAETSAGKHQIKHAEATADEATKAQAQQIMKELLA